MTRLASALLLTLTLASAPHADQQAADSARDSLHRPLDTLLDLYVRDGLVYYRALKSDRSGLDRYVAALGSTSLDGWSREEQIAFWLNAYDALVLRTVIDRYPIRGTSSQYPSNSIRQIPGAFERISHRVAGRAVTLDAIERDQLAAFNDPRVFVALGRGSVGGGRLRSEAFTGARLAEQLDDVIRELPQRHELLRVDTVARQLSVTPILSWREQQVVAAYADRADARFAARSPIERAVVAMVQPYLLPAERVFVEANEFRVVFHPYDWHLNDLTGRGGR
jgi:uncharacterized protein DUF547